MLVGDASETQYAAYTPNGELPAAIVVPFTAEEQERMLRKELSSTLREVCCLERSLPQVLQRLLVYYADSQTAAAAINRIIGGAVVYAAVKHIYGMFLQRQVQLEVRWHPRSTGWARRADTLSKCSKCQDDGDYNLLADRVYRRVTQQLGGAASCGLVHSGAQQQDSVASATSSAQCTWGRAPARRQWMPCCRIGACRRQVVW